MATIELEKMRFFAYHGFFEEERRIGAEYELTLSLEVNMSSVCCSDKLDDTLNYQVVYDVVKEQMAQSSKMIEYVSARVLRALVSRFPQIKKADLLLSKINPPLGGQVDRVTIRMSYPKDMK